MIGLKLCSFVDQAMSWLNFELSVTRVKIRDCNRYTTDALNNILHLKYKYKMILLSLYYEIFWLIVNINYHPSLRAASPKKSFGQYDLYISRILLSSA